MTITLTDMYTAVEAACGGPGPAADNIIDHEVMRVVPAVLGERVRLTHAQVMHVIESLARALAYQREENARVWQMVGICADCHARVDAAVCE